MMQDIFQLADKLAVLKNKKKALDEETKSNNEKIDETEQELVDLMLAEEIQNFNRGGHLFSLRNTLRASAKAGMQGELCAYLKENGAADLVKETVNANTLSGWVKEQIEENDGVMPAELDGYINLFEKTQISIRKG